MGGPGTWQGAVTQLMTSILTSLQPRVAESTLLQILAVCSIEEYKWAFGNAFNSELNDQSWHNSREQYSFKVTQMCSTVTFCFHVMKCILTGTGRSWLNNVLCIVTHSCPTLCDPMDYSPPGFSVHRDLQERILEWIVIPFSRGSSQPVSYA